MVFCRISIAFSRFFRLFVKNFVNRLCTMVKMPKLSHPVRKRLKLFFYTHMCAIIKKGKKQKKFCKSY